MGSFTLASLSSLPATAHTVALSMAMNHRIYVKPFVEPSRIGSAELIYHALDGTDFLMLYKGKPSDWLPGSKFAPHTSARLTTDPKWRLISSTGDYELFAKKDCS